ncbi:universal stress protein UspA-like protein [Pleurocapsa sp. PCC 7327]|uniref:universal stress protein n=1 Tax=Pleurocapsa sp. PCC 7327 TaxID=118163 RepID=UPI00029FD4E3|nr:universal stress protein [Pleurocapsa sp. PCC 7327]AFY77050.1 universal stress protein UspA-like protein [Pleurocapsa sp. PCC 7327]
MSFDKILVAIDMSEIHKNVFERALSLAQKNNASLMLLHALSPEEENSPLPIPPNLTEMYPAAGNDLTLEIWRQQWQEFERQGVEVLQSLAQKAIKAGVRVQYEQIPGSPARTICQVAREWQANLIVIGHRGRSGLSEMLLGSVSNYVVHHAPCSVLLVR